MNTLLSTPQFDGWIEALRDRIAKARVIARIDRAESGNFGDSAPVGEGISEMRIHVGAGYRVYFKQTGQEIYLLLVGGDKSSQDKDIVAAKALAKKLGV